MPRSNVATANVDDRDPASVLINRLRDAIDCAIHFLPTQGPISIFVHHNTLHPFEDLPFDEAVIEGGRRYGCEPYLSEDRYREEIKRGRISVEDLRQVLMDDLGDSADELVASFGTRYTLRLAMLQMTLHSAPEAELQWLLAESDLLNKFREGITQRRRGQMIGRNRTWVMRHRDQDSPALLRDAIKDTRNKSLDKWSDDQWESFTLRLLWRVCQNGVRSHRLTELTAASTLDGGGGESDDTLVEAAVNEVLIRFCGVFLDQGFANWPLPHREDGFAKAFAILHRGRGRVTQAWMKGMRDDLRQIASDDFDAMQSILESLERMGVVAGDVESTICRNLLALRGWAGMIWQAETNSPWLPHPVPKGSLIEYLAIRLLLQRHAIAAGLSRPTEDHDADATLASIDEITYTVFQLAQTGGWTPEQLLDMTPPQWTSLLREIATFDSVQRRRILHGAYERHYQVATLDALSLHSRARHESLQIKTKPAYLAIFCIDDREESFRRHLEEVDPECRTASAAGFFAVTMYYRGADHAHYRPLCPAIIKPKHYVREEPLFSAMDVSEKRADRRRQLGWLTHQVHANSRTLIGGWVTGVFGAFATFPMVARIMAPRLTSRIRETMSSFVRPPATELHIERVADEPGTDPDALGYSIDEMAFIVVRLLTDIGVVKDLPPIVVLFGHGSGSLNNPHESAYNCGACSGGRGGPNARAFASMANDPRVRRMTATLGVTIPEDVRFVGAFHNTCDDDVDYYDLDLLPRSHRELFRRIETSVNHSRAHNAHERSRRFESAPLDLTPDQALEHVEQRAEDLSQARPEYNHATNALVTVGRRCWTRGLFMDRRVFLTEYDPAVDDEQATVLTRILQAAIPVCAGISLEYFFSTVDTEGYGCGSKLPHNVASMIGVMTGAASDLRPGLSEQMVEIHEPMRMLFVIETTPELLDAIIAANPSIARLVEGGWVHVAVIDPDSAMILQRVDGKYKRHVVTSTELPKVASSMDWYRGQRDHLGYASIEAIS